LAEEVVRGAVSIAHPLNDFHPVVHALHRLNTSVLEGMNNRIKVIKRMAYGYRDTDYFFLKIRAAFPGKVR
ncbi:transposase, partial [Acinetobacter baumannii]|uniref:transposase n=1 Tax=Acinetobacter baumannii TaxID=470 RepID=UPI001F5B2205